MSTSVLDKSVLWSFREAAEVLGLPGSNDYKVVSLLARALEIQPKQMVNGKSKGLDRQDLDRIAKSLNKTLN